MKEEELREHAICSTCHQTIGSAGSLSFWTIILEHHHIQMRAMQRLTGLTLQLGSAKLAQIMGVDEEMTKTIVGPVKFTMCEKCAEDEPLVNILESTP